MYDSVVAILYGNSVYQVQIMLKYARYDMIYDTIWYYVCPS